jgi:adenylate kinase family enzyme
MAGKETVLGQKPIGDPARSAPAEQRDQETIAAIRDARRILVLGSSGAGKTYLSERLGEILGLDVIHLDAHFWRPDARPHADEKWREIVSNLSRREAWIMDGTYERSLDLRIPHAAAIIVLACTPARCLAHVIERQKRAKKQPRPDLPAGYVEQLDESHRRYVSHYPEVTHPAVLADIERYGPNTPVATLAAPEAIAPFLTQLRQTGLARFARSPRSDANFHEFG